MSLFKILRLLLVFAVLGAGVCNGHGQFGNSPMRDPGVLSYTSTSFTETDDLGVPADLKYAFILVRHSIVAPGDISYPNDYYYSRKWTAGQTTMSGRMMMKKLGRSLATRYRSYMNTFDLYKFYVTTMDTSYGYTSADDILSGMCEGRVQPVIHKKPETDKFQLLRSPQSCQIYANLKFEVDQYEIHDVDESTLFEHLRRCIGETTNPSSEWYINSRERLYNLWEVLDFELKSKETVPPCYTEDKEQSVRNIVNKYLQDAIFGRDNMPQYVVGPLLQEMIDGYNNLNPRLHLHITNDFVFAAVKSVLLQRKISVPDFGDTLMVEVDTNGDTRVYTYKPYLQSNNYHQNLFKDSQLSMKFYAITRFLQTEYQFGERIIGQEWRRRCEFTPLGGTSASRVPLTASTPPKLPPLLGSPLDRSIYAEDYNNRGRVLSADRPLSESSIGGQFSPLVAAPQLVPTGSRQVWSSPNQGVSVSYGDTTLSAETPLSRSQAPLVNAYRAAPSYQPHAQSYGPYGDPPYLESSSTRLLTSTKDQNSAPTSRLSDVQTNGAYKDVKIDESKITRIPSPFVDYDSTSSTQTVPKLGTLSRTNPTYLDQQTLDQQKYLKQQLYPASNRPVEPPAMTSLGPRPSRLLPTLSPTSSPTLSSTWSPTSSPTWSPTSPPTWSPTSSPTWSPTSLPTWSPKPSSTLPPTLSPSWPPTLPESSPPSVTYQELRRMGEPPQRSLFELQSPTAPSVMVKYP